MCLSRKKCYFPSGCVRVCSVCVCPHICLHHTSHPPPPHTLPNQTLGTYRTLGHSSQSELSFHASSAIFQAIRFLFSCKFCNIPTNQISLLMQVLQYSNQSDLYSHSKFGILYFNKSDLFSHTKSAIFQPIRFLFSCKVCNIPTIRSLFTK